ncbi:MAG TPA: hypothetical protein VMR59_01240 [Patescibacteria group bacterium]|jgi:predicted negative regulator of RcsB-dependent stress response|nr:hypothetical protein [Patescibacteria group bacterium]
MEEDNTNNNGLGLIGILLIIGVIYFWNQNSDLKKQAVAYQSCISSYQEQEQNFKTAIDDATSYLEQGGTDNYTSAQDSLNIDTTLVDCSSIQDYPTPAP